MVPPNHPHAFESTSLLGEESATRALVSHTLSSFRTKVVGGMMSFSLFFFLFIDAKLQRLAASHHFQEVKNKGRGR